MGSSDLRYRNGAIPALLQVFGYNRNEQSDNDISAVRASNQGDLSGLITPTGTDYYIRILKPTRAQLVAAYLSLSIQTGSSEPNPSLTISVSKTTSDTDLTVVTQTAAQIAHDQLVLKGSSTSFAAISAGQAINIDRLDLTPLLPKPASADFRLDCFVVGIHFKTVPAAGFHLYRFQVDGSALIMR